MNSYSIAASGKLEESSSVGMKGLHPFKLAFTSKESSVNSMFPNGKRELKVDESNRGRPKVECANPFPVLAAPNILNFGTGPSITLALFWFPPT